MDDMVACLARVTTMHLYFGDSEMGKEFETALGSGKGDLVEGDRDICHQYSILPSNVDLTMPPGIYGFNDTKKVDNNFLEFSFGCYVPNRADIDYLIQGIQVLNGLQNFSLRIPHGECELDLRSLT